MYVYVSLTLKTFFGFSRFDSNVITFTDGSCNFEHGLCTWTTPSTFKWIRNRGPSNPPATGPANDHTLGEDVCEFCGVNKLPA